MKKDQRKKIVLFVNSLKTFLWHRRPIADLLLENHEVIILSPPPNQDEDFSDLFNRYNIRTLELSRKGKNPLKELITLLHIIIFFSKEKPDVVHSFTIKPVIYTSLASIFIKFNFSRINSITGLGYVFTKRKKRFMLFLLIRSLYYLIIRFIPSFYIFQKKEDFDELTKIHTIKKYKIIAGSGVNTYSFKYSDLPLENNIVMISRLIEEKGILIYLEALKILQSSGFPFSAKLIGPIDVDAPNPIGMDQIRPYIQDRTIEYTPSSSQVSEEMKWAKIICYPTYYNEGIPKVFLEAKASGRLMPNNYTLNCDEINFECTKISAKQLANRIKDLILNPNSQPLKLESQIISEHYSALKTAAKIVESYPLNKSESTCK